MSAASNTNAITPWIPVIGTLSGAFMGFLASFLIAFFNKSTETKKARDDRDRNRLERIYEIIIEINNERMQEMGNAINLIHNNSPIKEGETKRIPLIIELEMLIKMYFPTLESDRKNLIDKVQNFGITYFEVRFTDWSKKNKQEKQEISGVLVKLQREIDIEVEKIKKSIIKQIKA